MTYQGQVILCPLDVTVPIRSNEISIYDFLLVFNSNHMSVTVGLFINIGN